MASTVLVLHESYGEVAIDISTPDAYSSLALVIVNHRLNAGFYPTPTEPAKPELTTDKASKLPDTIRAYVRGLWVAYREALKVYDRESSYVRLAREAISEKDGAKAIALLELRKDFQGESFQILEVRREY